MEELKPLPRLILIDAANFMNVYKKVATNYACPNYESRKNAFRIIPVVHFFVARGYTVLVIANEHTLKPHTTQLSYLLKELKAMNLLVHPIRDGKEVDDRAMLECAADYGAIILSCDKFRNHPDFKAITNRYVVGYERKKCKQDSDVTNNLGIECKYSFYLDGKCFAAKPTDDDYAKVQKSHEDFKKISPENLRRLALMDLYLHSDICSKIGAPLPEACTKFLDPEMPFPVNFEQFEKAAQRFYRRQ
uniref:RNase NYN domain-containing protein n=1 Tax=Panagrolaimus sp. PS1159 TaxID=55785 RepID=A0AC35GEK5_9BILA